MIKHESDNDAGILAKQFLSKVAFKGKVDQVLDNLYNAFFRFFNAQIPAKDALSSQGQATSESLGSCLFCHVLPLLGWLLLFITNEGL